MTPKIDFTKLKPILKPKNPQVTDPIRFPKLISPIEDSVKKDFALQMNKAMVDITKKMIDITKK